ncbi:MAG: glucosamine-6-phosphate deaminase [Verrucomicrobiota bacterium]
MEVIIQPAADAAAELVASLIADALRSNPRLVLGLATGCTMEAVYESLVRKHRDEGLDFSRCHTFNLDEYVGLPGSDRHSYRHFMNQRLFQRVNIDLRNTYVPDGVAGDLETECARYERLIMERGGIDLQLLGIGRTGHLGFNEPLSAFRSRTRVTALAPATIEQNSLLFSSPDQMPRRAITMGVGTILEARRCLLLATGESKAAILAQAVEGPISSMIPATALQLHAHSTVIVDEAAGSKLKDVDYYRGTFQHDAKWEKFRRGTLCNRPGPVLVSADERLG